MRHWQPAIKATVLALVILAVSVGIRAVANLEGRRIYIKKTVTYIEEATRIADRVLTEDFRALVNVGVVVEHALKTGASSTLAFHDYLEGSSLLEQFPALRGMVVFEWVTADGLPELVEQRDSDPARRGIGYPPLVPYGLSEGPQHVILTKFAPLQKGLGELGLDLLARPRADTALRSIASREGSISDPFTHFTGESVVAIYRPIFLDELDAEPAGVIATALSLDVLMNRFAARLAPYELAFSITDLGLIGSNLETTRAPIPIGGTLADRDRVFERELEVGGHVWKLQLRPSTPAPKIFLFDGVFALAALAAALSGLLFFRSLTQTDVLAVEVLNRTAQLEGERREAQERAQRDSLTGLLNRRGLMEAFDAAAHADPGSSATLVSMDLDNFKQINDTLGHMAGDALLCTFADMLRDRMSPRTAIARFGGDEFCVLLFDEEDQAYDMGLEILAWSRKPQCAGDDLVRFGTSIGIATAVAGETTLSELMANADIALYAAKDQGRDLIRVFDDGMRQHVTDIKNLTDDVRRGIERDEFVPYFQTQHDARTQALVGLEVLVRWNHPELGVLAPDRFLDCAKRANLLNTLDRRLLELASAAIVRLEEKGFEIPKYSVNVSLARILHPDLIDAVTSLPDSRAKLSFELLESDFLDDPSTELMWTLDTFREMGVGLEIDDFGSGRASIVALTHLNPDRFKIDRALVMPLCSQPQYERLVTSIVEMGRTLGISITAEGVESAEHVARLARIGVDTLQGYHFSKPCAEEDLEKVLVSATRKTA